MLPLHLAGVCPFTMAIPSNPYDPGQSDDRLSVPAGQEVESNVDEVKAATLGMSGGQFEPGKEFGHEGGPNPREGTAAGAFSAGSEVGPEMQTEGPSIGETIGGGLQGTQAGGTSQMDRMNPGPGGTGGNEGPRDQGNEGELEGIEGTDLDLEDESFGQITGTTGIARQDHDKHRRAGWVEEAEEEGEMSRMGTGGGRDDIGLPRQHVAEGPQEVRETEGEP
jgi:hypothetical protein